jgi:non-specific serine/threonine protein kinase
MRGRMARGRRAMNACQLPPGTRLRDFEIVSVLGGGRTSLVYQAYDSVFERRVTLKEYLPAAYAARDERLRLVALPGKSDAFDEGLRRFIAEARAMPKFHHASLSYAYQLFRENGSAYIVMPYYPGQTLRAKVRDGWRATGIGDLFVIVLPILEGLSRLHQAGYCHCGVSPDNLLIQDDGDPLLLDFGAIQKPGEFFGERAVDSLAPGFAALEQYGNDDYDIGAWTDIYAVSAVVYYLVTGLAPVMAPSRATDDALAPLAGFAAADLPARLLEVFEQGLAVSPRERFMSIEAFSHALDAGVREAMAHTSPATRAAAGEILSMAVAALSHSPGARRILRSLLSLRDWTRRQGASG